MYLCLVFFGYLSSEPSHRVVRKPRQPAEKNGDTLPSGYPALSGVQPQLSPEGWAVSLQDTALHVYPDDLIQAH